MKKWRNHPIVKKLGSLKVATVGLALLGILTFFGTLYQADNGLFAAQTKFFHTWLFRWYVTIPYTEVRFWFPFPGALGVCTVITINLLVATFFKIVWIPKKAGVLLIHIGMLFLLIGGGWTFYTAEESQISLVEGESSAFSVSYHEWELIAFKFNPDDTTRTIYSRDLKDLDEGEIYDFAELGIEVGVMSNFQNALAYPRQPALKDQSWTNASGIAMIQEKDNDVNPEMNFPGVTFRILKGTDSVGVLVYGAEKQPTIVEEFAFQVRRKKFPLPFEVYLIDFKEELHGGTGMAKAYSSRVKILKPNEKREVIIKMNHPFRLDGFTLFQASFSQDQTGSEISTFATVDNPGHLIPYISSIITGFGMTLHFIIVLIGHVRTSNKKKGAVKNA
jgi:hypothetical protein